MSKGEFGNQWYEKQLGTVDEEIARLATICQIRMLDAGIIERVVAGDESVCGRRTPKAFRQLRSLVGVHYSLTSDSLQSLGEDESVRILTTIRERLGKRFDIGGDR
ncbi:hypothetical protein [Povalibacter sp.]|uniref:hypothetical protein n=1 Tax=Povalibacter sp. TaxID=1962978 RepID=UPI002F3E9B76